MYSELPVRCQSNSLQVGVVFSTGENEFYSDRLVSPVRTSQVLTVTFDPQSEIQLNHKGVLSWWREDSHPPWRKKRISVTSLHPMPFPHRPAEDRRQLYMVEVHGLKSSKCSSDWLTCFLFTMMPLIVLLQCCFKWQRSDKGSIQAGLSLVWRSRLYDVEHCWAGIRVCTMGWKLTSVFLTPPNTQLRNSSHLQISIL